MDAQLVDPDTSAVLARLSIPVETGGFIPALQDSHDPIEGFPEVDYGEPSLGSMVRQGVDMRAFEGQRVALRVTQHTKVADNGFFSLMDDICVGEMRDAELVWK